MVVDSWLERAAASAPSAIAVQTPVKACSYAELLERARAGAGELAARGGAPGERVAIALPAGLDFVCALHACMLLGAVAVPVDLRLGERERAAIVDGAAVVVDEPLRAAAVRGAPAGVRGAFAVRGASAGMRSAPADRRGAPAGATHDLDAVAAVIHTSGTTSAPKPVELTYGNFLWSALGSAVALGLDPHERWLCNLPLSHVGGLSILLRSAIYATTAVVHERFDTELTLRAVMGEAGGGVHLFEPPTNRARAAAAPVARGEISSAMPVTLVSLVATTLTRLLDAGLERPPALRCALTGGGPVPAALLDRARAAGVPVSLTYGMTETCSQVTTLPLADLGMSAASVCPIGRRREPVGGAPHSRPAALLHARAHRRRRGDRSGWTHPRTGGRRGGWVVANRRYG